MADLIARREALRHLLVLSAAAAAPAFLLACSKKPSCSDVTGLSPDDVTARGTNTYTDTAPDASKKCSLCAQYQPAAANSCGTCKVIKGPISPEGWCKLYVAKT